MDTIKSYLMIALVAIIAAGGYLGYIFIDAKKTDIENPTDAAIKVQIDDMETVEIAAKSFVEVSIDAGDHTVKLNDLEVGTFTKKNFEAGSILNPTQSQFILETAVYSNNMNTSSPVIEKKITIGGISYTGPFEEITDLYVANNKFWNTFLFFMGERNGHEWDYELRKDMPNEITTKGHSDITKKKIYFPEDFEVMFNMFY